MYKQVVLAENWDACAQRSSLITGILGIEQSVDGGYVYKRS